MEAKQNDPTEPSTSSGGNNQEEDQELEDFDNQQLNDALENYSQKHNLTAQKVKTIIYVRSLTK
jgi:predicted metal-dependent hydrolase